MIGYVTAAFAVAITVLFLSLLMVLILIVKEARKTAKITFVRMLQFSSLFFSLLMVVGRLGMEISFVSGNDSPLGLEILFTIFEFLYFLTSNIYYLELLKPIKVLFSSKFLKEPYPFIYQIVAAVLNFVTNFASVFRYSLYVSATETNWAAQWGSYGFITIVETAILAIVIASITFRTLSNAKVGTDSAQETSNTSKFSRIKILILVFILLQVLQFACFMSSGWIKVLSKADSNTLGLIEPLAAVGTGFSGLQIGIFTIVFQNIIDIFIKSKSDHSSNLQTSGPHSAAEKPWASSKSAL
ncbi:hypothetical protein HK103_007589 [Boothiomyces macroporosus]|uniref:Uncharacterized protein n=1 Tax=Boothiomyces macroporosus TaxID=261099 RepID=A0AAD5UCC4_9FUNG|nr:hypothetical protein HK103_007589 [Boothiomyces macroporosus]